MAQDGNVNRVIHFLIFRTFDLRYSIYDVNIAYAITCHKSQGSEAKVVIQIVDKTQRRTLNRSLVYTGYTRTREVNVIIGQVETLNESLTDISNLERVSLIKERL